MMPRIVVDVSRYREVERRRFYVTSTDIEAPGHMGSCPGYALLTSQGANRNDYLSGRSQEKYARTELLRESESEGREELELSEVQGMCLGNLGINMLSRWRFDMRTHLAVTS